jgi:hypothetical protein
LNRQGAKALRKLKKQIGFLVKEPLIDSVHPELVGGRVAQTLITSTRRSWFDKLTMNAGVSQRLLN